MKKEVSGIEPRPQESPEHAPMGMEELPPEAAQAQARVLNIEHDREAQQPYFVDYLDPEIPLEERLATAFGELQISQEQQDKILAYLKLLELKHTETFYHSIRVGLAARGIAKHLNMDEKALLYAGLLHDIGKSMVPLSTLSKTEGWTADDTAAMDEHVLKSYELLRDTFDFSAEIVKLHHRFQSRPYPEKVPEPLHPYTDDTKKKIESGGRMLALADVYDALHRINEKFGGREAFSGDKVKEQMLQMNPDQTELVEELYDAGIFTTATFPRTESSQ